MDADTWTKSSLGDGPVLTFSPKEWEAFLGGVRLGEFDLD
jgi:hypothetical protein